MINQMSSQAKKIEADKKKAQKALDITKELKKAVNDLPGNVKKLIQNTSDIPGKVFQRIASFSSQNPTMRKLIEIGLYSDLQGKMRNVFQIGGSSVENANLEASISAKMRRDAAILALAAELYDRLSQCASSFTSPANRALFGTTELSSFESFRLGKNRDNFMLRDLFSLHVFFEASNDIMLDIDGESMIGEEFDLWFQVDWSSGSPAYSVRIAQIGRYTDLGTADPNGRLMVDGITFLSWLNGRAPTLALFFDFMLGRP
jgi:hypothetical protein